MCDFFQFFLHVLGLHLVYHWDHLGDMGSSKAEIRPLEVASGYDIYIFFSINAD